ncbi:MAG: BatD family protein [Porticoccaceae bacterium]
MSKHITHPGLSRSARFSLRWGLSFLTALFLSSFALAELTIKTDRQSIGADESLQMVIRYDGQVLSGEPELGVLLRDWEILSNNRNQQYSWANGESISYTEWQLTLLPRSTGTLIIPSITFKNDISNALEIEVTPSRVASSVAQTIFAESSVDSAEVFPQQQIIYTARLFSASRLSDLALTELDVDNALMQRIGESQYQKSIGGRTYIVVEVQYALFPTTTGQLTIPPLRFSGYEVSGRTSFFNRGNRVIRTTDTQTVTVKPLPSGQAPATWIPAQALTIDQQWSQSPQQLTVGEPITRTVTVTARRLTGAQLPPLPSEPGDLYKSYPDQPKIGETIDRGSVVGQRIESTAIVPQQPGELVLPAISVDWWDTQANQLRTATLPVTTITVAAAAPPASPEILTDATPSLKNQPAPASSPAPAEPSVPQAQRWLQISLAANAVLLALLATLFYWQRHTSKQPARRPIASRLSASAEADEQQLWRQIDQHAKNSAPAPLCEAIVAWAERLSGGQIKTLKQLQEHLVVADVGLAEELKTLENKAYSGRQEGEALSVGALLTALKKRRRHLIQAQQNKITEQELQGLYE